MERTVEHFIQKLNITEEAEFDIECMNASSEFNKRQVKAELEFYIEHRIKLQHKTYFRVRDFIGDFEIIYFIKKGKRFGNMQIWNLVGICESQFWDEEMEESGIIRSWYETKIHPDDKEPDWVEQLRERQMIEERERKIEEEMEKKYDKLFGQGNA